MNDQEIDTLIAAAAVSEEQVASLPLGGLVTELREHTMTTTDRSPLEELTARSRPLVSVNGACRVRAVSPSRQQPSRSPVAWSPVA